MSKTKGPRIKDRPFPQTASRLVQLQKKKDGPEINVRYVEKNIRVDEVDGLGLELIGRVEIG
jgi:hypothetical protein